MGINKICCKCSMEKPVTSFPKSSENKDGRKGTCKACVEIKNKIYREKNKEKRKIYDKKYIEENKEKIKARQKEYSARTKDKIDARTKEWADRNAEKLKKYRAEYYQANKDRISNYKKNNRSKLNEYRKNLIKTNQNFALSERIRSRIGKLLRINNIKKTHNSIDLLGCSISFLKNHLESKFTSGMTWENRGNNGWHIDHIKPCASFDLSDPEQQKQCFHYTNLQPLWATREIAMSYGEGIDYIGNIEKGVKLND